MAIKSEELQEGFTADIARMAQGVGKFNKSWDFWVYRKMPAQAGIKEAQLAHLGTVKEVRAMVENTVEVIWHGPFWCVHQGDGFEIEFDVGGIDSKESDILDSINVVVKGRGDPLPVLVEFSRVNRLTLCDLATGEELEFFHLTDEQWLPPKKLIGRAVDELKNQHQPLEKGKLAALPSPMVSVDADEATYTYFWANPGHEPYNFVALEGTELLIGQVPAQRLEDFIEQYRINGKVRVSKRVLALGSQRRRLMNLVELNDHLNTPVCDLVFHGSEVPTRIEFNSPLAKRRFIDVALSRVPKPRKTFEAERMLDGINIPFLLLTLIFSVAALYWPSQLLRGFSILCGVVTVIPLFRYFIRGPQMYEVYTFNEA